MRLTLTLLFLLISFSSAVAKDDITKELITSNGKTRPYYLYVQSNSLEFSQEVRARQRSLFTRSTNGTNKMAELKTKPTDASVKEFLNQIADKQRRDDCFTIAKMMEEATGAKPKMWGPSIVGFGTFHYKYDSGREGDWLVTGFSPRKNDLTLYLMMGFEQHRELMAQLGKYKTSKTCLYLKRLDDVHLPTLKKLIKQSIKQLREYQKSKSKS